MSNQDRNTDLPDGQREAARAVLASFLAEGIPIHPEAPEGLVEFAVMVAEWGGRMNLSGYRDPRSVMEYLICDALALWNCAQELIHELPRRITDLGSGAGFPGLPIAMTAPNLEVILVESREKRHYFQRAVRRKLRLEHVRIRLGRIEDLDPTRSDLVLAQGVGQSDSVVKMGVHWLREGGTIMIPISDPAMSPSPHPAIISSGVESYSVPARPGLRFLWWGRLAESYSPAL